MDTINDILLINLTYFNTDDLEEFVDTIEHELVHAMDPKVRDQRLFKCLLSLNVSMQYQKSLCL